MRGHSRALRADRVLRHLHDHALTGFQHIADLACFGDLFEFVIGVAGREHVSRVQERVLFETDVNKRRLHAGKDVLHLPEIDVADETFAALLLHVELDRRPVLDDRNACIERVGVDQNFLIHFIKPFFMRGAAADRFP